MITVNVKLALESQYWTWVSVDIVNFSMPHNSISDSLFQIMPGF